MNVDEANAGAVDAAAAAAAGDDGDESAAAAPRYTSYARFFFNDNADDDDETKAQCYSCLLAPESGSASSKQVHHVDIKKTGGTRNLSRHLESAFHIKSMAHFNSLIGAPQFMQADEAARLVIEEATRRRSAGSIGTLFNGAKRARSTDSDALAGQLMRELTFVAFLLSKGAFSVCSLVEFALSLLCFRPGISFNAVEDENLAQFIQMSKQQPLPSRKRIADTLLPLMYELVMQDRNVLLKAVDFFSITTDAWTSVAHEQYLAVTVHFIDAGFVLHGMLLDLIPMSERHTWQNMTRAIASRLAELMPAASTLVCTVTDNGCDVLVVLLLHDVSYVCAPAPIW